MRHTQFTLRQLLATTVIAAMSASSFRAGGSWEWQSLGLILACVAFWTLFRQMIGSGFATLVARVSSVRLLIYCQPGAVILTAIAAHLDRSGARGLATQLAILPVILAAYLLPFFPFIALCLVCKLQSIAIQPAVFIFLSIALTFAHFLAALPLVQ